MSSTTNPTNPSKDHWTPKAYTSAADFVHKLTSKVTTLLAPAPSDKILDIGCGDGALTVQLAAHIPNGSIHGLDKSANFITHAQATYPASKYPNVTFTLRDCAHLDDFAAAHPNTYDKVFSNAALHWILRPESRRIPTIQAIHDVLKPGGKFVFEMGGAGNVAEAQAALLYALVREGIPFAEACEVNPWFFPSEVLMRQFLEGVGFEVESVELEYRPTKLEEGEGGGVEGWIRLMGAIFLEKVSADRKEAVLSEIVDVLRKVCTREEGGEWLGYTRCRGVARKIS
jgi:trans-aconitate methyltransferase